MNKQSCLLLGIVAAMSVGPARADAGDDPRIVSVTGSAEIKVVPDEVVLTLGIETFSTDLGRAKEDNDSRAAKTLAFAKAAGIESKHIQTDYIHIAPVTRHNYDSGGKRRNIHGFEVRKTIELVLKELVKFEDVLSGCLDAGVTNVHGVQFRTTELRKYRDEARALAIGAAREKALALAGELGQSIGRPRRIEEVSAGWRHGYNHARWGSYGSNLMQNTVQFRPGPAAEMAGTIALGQISVTAQVRVSFDLTDTEAH